MEDPRYEQVRRLPEEHLRRVGEELRSELYARAWKESRNPRSRGSYLVVPLLLSYVHSTMEGLEDVRTSVEYLLRAMPDLDVVPFVQRALGWW